jgi:hypothetical protein
MNRKLYNCEIIQTFCGVKMFFVFLNYAQLYQMYGELEEGCIAPCSLNVRIR